MNVVLVQYNSLSQSHKFGDRCLLVQIFIFVSQHLSLRHGQTRHSRSYSSSPLKSSWKTALTSCFLLILPMALRGMWSTTRRTCGIL